LKIAGILTVLLCQSIIAQTASTYFQAQTGYKWYFECVPLDSLNNPVNAQKFFSINSFGVNTTYVGKNTKLVFSKTGSLSTINFPITIWGYECSTTD